MLRHLLIKLMTFIFTCHFKVSLRIVGNIFSLYRVGIITYSDRMLLLGTLVSLKFDGCVSGEWLGLLLLGGKIEDVLLDDVIFVFELLFDPIYFALNSLDRTMSELKIAVGTLILLLYLFLFPIFFVFVN